MVDYNFYAVIDDSDYLNIWPVSGDDDIEDFEDEDEDEEDEDEDDDDDEDEDE
jgi:hypothetical protein